MQLKPTGNFESCAVPDYSVHANTDGMKFIFHSLLCFDLQAGIVCHSNPAYVVHITYSYFPVGCCGNKCHIKPKGCIPGTTDATRDPWRKAALQEGFLW